MGSNMTSETLYAVNEHAGGIAPSATFTINGNTADGGGGNVDGGGKDEEGVRLLVDPDDAAYKNSRMGSRGRGGGSAMIPSVGFLSLFL